ncbi:MAG: helix-turn-helix transcriptional regulator [Eubacterium sp.]|nr:helix-turn-helix transcriptional regulator [Eubacterium sp.]
MDESGRIVLHIVGDENGWGLPMYDGYLEFPRQDESGIAVLYQDHAVTVMPHKHFYHELALIIRGRGTHTYQGEEPVPLLPGDVILIEPDVEHSYFVESQMTIVNCQFFTRKLNMDFNRIQKRGNRPLETIYEESQVLHRWNELRREADIFWEKTNSEGTAQEMNATSVRRKGIIGLSMKEREVMERICLDMIDEQNLKDRDSAAIKSMQLQYLLTWLKRIVRRQNTVSVTQRVDTRQQKIQNVITYIEEHLAENIEVKDLASQMYWSEGYFRNVFKEFTGFTPVQYINRKKIMKSIDYIEKSNMNVQEAAEKVGIYDPSYYSRLFKQHMGYSPREISKSS